MVSTAELSTCGTYRYQLTRSAADAGFGDPLVFCMLNPSTADASVDDPTIRRIVNFATAWCFKYLEVVNLYAYRSPSPAELRLAADPIGTDNDLYLHSAAGRAHTIVCAWGVHAPLDRVEHVVKNIFGAYPKPLYCLGTNRDGSPKHPLYVPGDKKLVLYRP